MAKIPVFPMDDYIDGPIRPVGEGDKGFVPPTLKNGVTTPNVKGGFNAGDGTSGSYSLNDNNVTEQDILSWLNDIRGNGLSESSAALINYLLGEFSAQRNRDYQSSQNDLAYQRQRYESDLAYERTKFSTLYQQFLAAGMTPAAALQAAAGSSPDTSGSAPAAGSGAQGSGASAQPGFSRANTLLNGINTLFHGMQVLGDIGAQYAGLNQQREQYNAGLAQQQRMFDAGLEETRRQFNVSNFDAVQAMSGSDTFYGDTAPLFYKRGKSGFSPLSSIPSADMSTSDIASAINSDEFPELAKSLSDNAGNPYYNAALRHFLKSELGSRAFASNQRNLQLQNRFLSDKIDAQQLSNTASRLSLAQYDAAMYSVLESAIKNDSAFRERYGIYFDGADYRIPIVEDNNGNTFNDVRLTDYIGMMHDGFVDNMSLQGMSYLDVLSFTSQYQSLTLQTDLDYYNASREALLNDAKSKALMSAVDYITSQRLHSVAVGNPTFDWLFKVKTFMNGSGLSDFAKFNVDLGIKLYGIKSANKNAAANRNLMNANYTDDFLLDENGRVLQKTHVYH